MWRDCSDFLREALQRFPREQFFNGQETEDIVREFQMAIADTNLQRPRPPVIADLGSAIAFSIGKAYLAAGGPGPEAFAKKLLETLDVSASREFQFAVERGGYINVHFLDEGKTSFLQRLLALAPEEFLTPKMESSWADVEERLQQQQDEHLQEFLNLSISSKRSAEYRLMALGVLSDPELDLEPFLRDLKGKQNLPWAFRRFDFDLRECESLLVAREDGLENPLLQNFLNANRERLIWLRWNWERACNEGQPELFFSFLHSLFHLNYSFLNRPDFRLALSQATSHRQANDCRQALQFLQNLFRVGLIRLTGEAGISESIGSKGRVAESLSEA